jgi:hypothetical protein
MKSKERLHGTNPGIVGTAPRNEFANKKDMTKQEVREANEKHDTHQNGNPFLYPETLYISAIYKGDGIETGEHPFVLVETGQCTQEYMLISLQDGMPAGVNGGSPTPGSFMTACEWDIRKYLSKNNMDLVAADAKTYYQND